jgi:hypothetical protein
MPGDFDVSDRDYGPPDAVVAMTTLHNTVLVITQTGAVWRMAPTLVVPTWERLPNVPLS